MVRTQIRERAISSVGRAVRLHRKGRGFESLIAHEYKIEHGLSVPFLFVDDGQANCFACVGTRKPERCEFTNERGGVAKILPCKIIRDLIPYRFTLQLGCIGRTVLYRMHIMEKSSHGS